MGLDSDEALGVGLEEEQYVGPTDEEVYKGQQRMKNLKDSSNKKRKSSNYTLERYLESKEREGGGPANPDLWEQIKDGFVSPEQALEFPVKNKLQGTFRAIRVASASYEVTLVTPEPIVKMLKLKERRKL